MGMYWRPEFFPAGQGAPQQAARLAVLAYAHVSLGQDDLVAAHRLWRDWLLGGGGVAVHRHEPVPAALTRSFADIDLVVGRKGGHGIAAGLAELGYAPNDRFNAVHGARRLLFYDHGNARQMDVFVGEFAMCHRLDLSARLNMHALALSPADLLLTKLQIVEINSKDIVDAIRLILGHEVRVPDLPEGPGQAAVVSLDRLAESQVPVEVETGDLPEGLAISAPRTDRPTGLAAIASPPPPATPASAPPGVPIP